ncbi:hypothetical protein GCM10015535_49920 [Streptomyces gelaticus]|uniref:Zinc-finger domain-containing protein n=1 Tax=Streptomyces gelaticus TaxID=285446 RepID=A0ABQ2W3W0_9ACTN|nr:hypothetical protein GCM10015535_49920 [Streptomyces gelaticus]
MVTEVGRWQVADDEVLHRAVLDHTVLCDTCSRGGPCSYLRRLRALARVAARIRVAGAGPALGCVGRGSPPCRGRDQRPRTAWRMRIRLRRGRV